MLISKHLAELLLAHFISWLRRSWAQLKKFRNSNFVFPKILKKIENLQCNRNICFNLYNNWNSYFYKRQQFSTSLKILRGRWLLNNDFWRKMPRILKPNGWIYCRSRVLTHDWKSYIPKNIEDHWLIAQSEPIDEIKFLPKSSRV